MKVFIVLSALIAVSLAGSLGYQGQSAAAYDAHRPVTPPIPILKSDSQVAHDGSYAFNYETGNGIAAGEQGVVKNAGNKDHEAITAQGYYQYTGDDGVPVQVKYTADENGFQAQGSHIPTPPPVPQELIKAYEEAAQHNDGDDGLYRGQAQPAQGGYKQQAVYQQAQQQAYYH